MSLHSPTYLFVREEDCEKLYRVARDRDSDLCADLLDAERITFGQYQCFFWCEPWWLWGFNEDSSMERFLTSLDYFGIQNFVFWIYDDEVDPDGKGIPNRGSFGSLTECRWFLRGAYGLY